MLRIIVTASAGIVGALLGSGVTGWINIKNAKATREAERAMWELRRAHDLGEARREEKRDLYSTYSTALQEVTTLIGFGHLSDPRRLDEGPIMEARKVMQSTLYSMSLLPGTDLVIASTAEAAYAQADLLKLVEDSINENTVLSDEDFEAACEAFRRKSVVTMVLMRKSLEKELRHMDATTVAEP